LIGYGYSAVVYYLGPDLAGRAVFRLIETSDLATW